jgi:carbamoyltransferase
MDMGSGHLRQSYHRRFTVVRSPQRAKLIDGLDGHGRRCCHFLFGTCAGTRSRTFDGKRADLRCPLSTQLFAPQCALLRRAGGTGLIQLRGQPRLPQFRMDIVGISAYYHDSAAALLRDGQLVAAAQEERFTRKKHDSGFPVNALEYCLDEGGISLDQVDRVVFYDKPLLTFDRLLETYLAYAPAGLRSFIAAMPVWLKEKLYLKSQLKRELASMSSGTEGVPELMFTEHHQSHAASAFYPSPFEEAAVLCMDGVGEWATTSVWHGKGHELIPKWEINFPHSLGLLYSAFTYFAGFKVNSGEYKLMGLAPYGEPKYAQLIFDHLIDVKDDGTFRLDMRYFNYATGLTMTNRKFVDLFGAPARAPESLLTQREMDLAASVQAVTEEVVLRLGRTAHRELGTSKLCLAGGVALNCVANGRLQREGPFEDIWIQPAAGDAGGSIGAAYAVWHSYFDKPRTCSKADSMVGSYLGPRFDNDAIGVYLQSVNAVYEELPDEMLMPRLAKLLASENVIGWFQGRMEFGPRALGAAEPGNGCVSRRQSGCSASTPYFRKLTSAAAGTVAWPGATALTRATAPASASTRHAAGGATGASTEERWRAGRHHAGVCTTPRPVQGCAYRLGHAYRKAGVRLRPQHQERHQQGARPVAVHARHMDRLGQ